MTKVATSIEQYLKNIKHLKRWKEINGRDLLDKICNGKVPSRGDIKDLKEHCSYQGKALKEKTESNVVDMGKFYLSKSQDKPTISKSQYISRIAHITEFLHFIGKERVKYKPTAAELFDELDKMKTRLKSGKLKGKSKKYKEKFNSWQAMANNLVIHFLLAAVVQGLKPISKPRLSR